MPDKRTHRGPHPDDADLFSEQIRPVLSRAVADMSWLLSRGYAETSTLKLVGDRYRLSRRQRMAVMRCSCSDKQARGRAGRQLPPEETAGKTLVLDGYNILITIEAALGGGVLLTGRDGCIRDLASIHGTYRNVAETLPAIDIIALSLKRLNVGGVVWYLDKPVSNSGRLKKNIDGYAGKHGLKWTVELMLNPDKVLVESDFIIASSDSAVLDGCKKWMNLASYIIASMRHEKSLNLLNLSDDIQD